MKEMEKRSRDGSGEGGGEELRWIQQRRGRGGVEVVVAGVEREGRSPSDSDIGEGGEQREQEGSG